MFRRDYRDMAGGALLLFGGAAYAWYAADQYNLGTLRRMGPGLFPLGLGILLAAFGVMLMVPAFLRQGQRHEVRVWSPLFVISSVVAFAVTIRSFGLLPAIVGVTVISSFAELKVRPVSLLILCGVLSLLAWLIFRVGLGAAIPMYRWPF